jgi:hypothetical protein
MKILLLNIKTELLYLVNNYKGKTPYWQIKNNRFKVLDKNSINLINRLKNKQNGKIKTKN